MSRGVWTVVVAIGGCAVVACTSPGHGTTSSSGGTTSGVPGISGLDGGSPCADGGDCSSTTCLGGRCCNDACPVAAPACAAIGCDENGACIHPGPTQSCGPTSCRGPTSLSPRVCDGNGNCIFSLPVPCPANYGCNPTTAACNATCQGDMDCDLSIAFCDATGACVPKRAGGSPCLENGACLSRSCLGGFCCAGEFCPPDPDTNCAANACGPDAGSCLYPTCGGGLGCGITGVACLLGCQLSSDCATGSSCDPRSKQCCSDLPPAAQIYVDGFAGMDTGCCGSLSAPCLSLTRAMERISSSGPHGVSGATIHAFNSNGTLEWMPAERWPVQLGLGVTLIAPNLYFDVLNQGDRVFEVRGYSATDTAPVTLEGDPVLNGAFIHVGFLSGPLDMGTAGTAVDATRTPAVPLTISNAWLDWNQLPGGARQARRALGPRRAPAPDRL
jgi:hypothetical protein